MSDKKLNSCSNCATGVYKGSKISTPKNGVRPMIICLNKNSGKDFMADTEKCAFWRLDPAKISEGNTK